MEAPRRRDASHWAGPVPAGDWRAGTRVGGRYVIEEQIGEGASAVTYRARDEVLGRPVALKVLRSRHARDPEVIARFEREARIAAAISHPHVVAVYDYGSDGGAFFIVLQFVYGHDLRSIVERRGPLDPAESVRIVGQLLAGLGAIHLAGIVHRDIKPSNVLIGRDGGVRLTDFGVAYEVVADRLTSHGTTVGTATYMAPEQARGGELSPATDLYAVGIVLFELLTGRLPFEHDNPMATLLAQIQSPPPRPSEVVATGAIPPRLEAVVLRALEKDPTARFASAAAMSAALAGSFGDPIRSVDTTRLPTPVPDVPRVVPAPSSSRRPGSRGATQPATGPSRRFSPGQHHPAGVAPGIRRRRLGAWVLPLGGALIALAILSVVVLVNKLGEGSGEETPPTVPEVAGPSSPTATTVAPREAVAGGTATATADAEPSATTRSVPDEIRLNTPTSTPPPTEEPTSTPPATATATSPPTETSVPTETPISTESPEPPTETPVPPTETSLPPTPTLTAVVVEEPPAGVSSGPPSTGASAGSATGSVGPDDTASLVIPAESWEGGEFRTDIAGRPATLLTRGGNRDRASVFFVLDEIPADGLTVRFLGFETLADEPAQVEIEINGRRVWEGDSRFSAGGGVWVPAELALLAEDFRIGENQIEVRFRAPGGRDGDEASLALGEVRLLPAESSTEAGSDVGEDGAVPVEETNDSGGGSEAAPTIAPASGG